MPQKIDTSKIDDMKVKYLGVSRPNDWRNVFSSIFAVYITYHLIIYKTTLITNTNASYRRS
jgi:hypothetical protein